jgi:hypothetical protein
MKMNRTRLIAILGGSGALLAGAAAFLTLNPDSERQYQFREEGAQASFAGYNDYMNMLRVNQVTGEIDPAAVQAAWTQLLQTAQKTNTLNWETRGPDNHGGRTRSLLVSRSNSNIVYAGSVGGGLYRSTNGGASWTIVSDPGSNQSVASICQAANGDIYYGTGEIWMGYGGTGQNTTPSFAGRGVYKSTDGINFVQLPSTLPVNNSGSAAWTAVADIEAHPTDAGTIYAATNNGLMKTTDGGVTWAQLLSGGITDFAISKTGTLYVNQAGRTMKSVDGTTFTEVSQAVQSPTALPRRSGGRIRYTVSPQDENYVYCVQTSGSQLAGVYRTTDGGATWSRIGQRSNNFDPLCNGVGAGRYCQGIWDLFLTVSAKDKDKIWLGGITVWSWSTSEGWVQASTLNDFAQNPFYLHADSHELIVDPNNPDVIFTSNDGGVFKSNNHGATWFERNLGYNTYQYFGFGVGKDRKLLGGCQDNGTSYLDFKSVSPHGVKKVFGGDGGHSDISWLNPKVMFAETQNGNFYRSDDEGEGWADFANGYMDLASQQGLQLSSWMMPFELWETTNDAQSQDTVRFQLLPGIRSMGFGDGVKRTFRGKITHPQSTAKFISNKLRIVAGPLTAVANANGVVSGDATGVFNADSGYFDITFNTPPIAEVILTCNVYLPVGSQVNLKSAIGALPIRATTTSRLDSGQVLKVQDPIQSMFFVGLTSHVTASFPKIGGIFMTRDVHDFSKTPEWWQIAHFGNGVTPHYMKISNDGNHLFVSTSNGRLYRISNLQAVRRASQAFIDSANYALTVTQIGNWTGRVVTGIDVDPNDANRVAVSLGNYGNSAYVYLSTNALSGTPSFQSKQGDLPTMPCYSVSFDKGNSNRLLVGSEWGVFMTDNLSSTTPSYSEENNGMARVPVFEIEQYRTDYLYDPNNPISSPTEGDFFIATHGRGWFQTTTTSVNRPLGNGNDEAISAKESLGIYPNPATDVVRVPVGEGDATLTLRSMDGRLVRRIDFKNTVGAKAVPMQLEGLPKGQYILTRSQGGTAVSEVLIKR